MKSCYGAVQSVVKDRCDSIPIANFGNIQVKIVKGQVLKKSFELRKNAVKTFLNVTFQADISVLLTQQGSCSMSVASEMDNVGGASHVLR